MMRRYRMPSMLMATLSIEIACMNCEFQNTDISFKILSPAVLECQLQSPSSSAHISPSRKRSEFWKTCRQKCTYFKYELMNIVQLFETRPCPESVSRNWGQVQGLCWTSPSSQQARLPAVAQTSLQRSPASPLTSALCQRGWKRWRGGGQQWWCWRITGGQKLLLDTETLPSFKQT